MFIGLDALSNYFSTPINPALPEWVQEKKGNFAGGVSIEKRDVLIDGTKSKPADVYMIAIDIYGASSVDFSTNVEEPPSNAVNRKNSKFLVR
jgi:hypothetical protein